jgi:hypothetical protein
MFADAQHASHLETVGTERKRFVNRLSKSKSVPISQRTTQVPLRRLIDKHANQFQRGTWPPFLIEPGQDFSNDNVGMGVSAVLRDHCRNGQNLSALLLSEEGTKERRSSDQCRRTSQPTPSVECSHVPVLAKTGTQRDLPLFGTFVN